MLWLEATSPSQVPAAKGLLLLPALHHKDRLMMQAARPLLLPSLRYCSAVGMGCKSPDMAAVYILLLICFVASSC